MRAFRGWNNLGRSCQLRESTGDGLVPIHCRVPVTKGGHRVGVTHPRLSSFVDPPVAAASASFRRTLWRSEDILGQVVASFSQTVVATDQEVLMAKTGYMGGRAFGKNAISFDYSIGGVEVRSARTSARRIRSR